MQLSLTPSTAFIRLRPSSAAQPDPGTRLLQGAPLPRQPHAAASAATCRRANVVPLKCRKSNSGSFPYSGQALECGL
jgi:hypothetical protein